MPQNSKSLLEKATPFLLVLSIILAFFVGVLWQKVSNLEKGKTKTSDSQKQGQIAEPEDVLGIDALKSYAKELGLDEKKYSDCIDNADFKDEVKKEVEESTKIGVNATPSFLINGRLISGALSFDTFQKIIEFELKGGDWQKPDETVKILVDGNPQNGEIGDQIKNLDIANSPAKGEAGAKVKVIEFADFECPACAYFHSATFAKLDEEYIQKGKVYFAYKNFPLVSIHEFAQKAAEASLCANQQGKFWEYYNKIFSEMAKIIE